MKALFSRDRRSSCDCVSRGRGRVTKWQSAISVTALLVAVLGTTPLGNAAYRTVVPKNSVGAAQLRNNAVSAAKVKDHSLLATDFADGQVPPGPAGAAGPQGPKGDKGDRGPKGDSATRLWVKILSDHTIARKSPGVLAVSVLSQGGSEVDFDRDVSSCAFFATPAVLAITASVLEGPAPSKIRVWTVSAAAGGFVNVAVYVEVVC